MIDKTFVILGTLSSPAAIRQTGRTVLKIIHYITLHNITLHYITLHYIALHYITLHYIAYITLDTLYYILYVPYYMQSCDSYSVLQCGRA